MVGCLFLAYIENYELDFQDSVTTTLVHKNCIPSKSSYRALYIYILYPKGKRHISKGINV